MALGVAVAGLPALAGGTDCAPGLDKRAAPCVAPGQAMRWQVGARLPIRTPWYELRDWDLYGLPEPAEGTRYVRVDDDILLVAIASGVVLGAVATID